MLEYSVLDTINYKGNIIYRLAIPMDEKLEMMLNNNSIKDLLHEELDKIAVEFAGKGVVVANIVKLKESDAKVIVVSIITYSSYKTFKDLLSVATYGRKCSINAITAYPMSFRKELNSHYVHIRNDLALETYSEARRHKIFGLFAKAFHSDVFIDNYVFVGKEHSINLIDLGADSVIPLFTSGIMNIFFSTLLFLQCHSEKIKSKKPNRMYIMNSAISYKLMKNFVKMYVGISKSRAKETSFLNKNTAVATKTGLILARDDVITNIAHFEDLKVLSIPNKTKFKFASGIGFVFEDKSTKIYRVGDSVDDFIHALKGMAPVIPNCKKETIDVFRKNLSTILWIGRETGEATKVKDYGYDVVHTENEDLPILSIMDFR